MDNFVADYDKLNLYRVVVDKDANKLDPADYDKYVADYNAKQAADPIRYRKDPMTATEWAEDQFFKAELEGYCSRFWTTKGVATKYANLVKKNTKFDAWVEIGIVDWTKT